MLALHRACARSNLFIFSCAPLVVFEKVNLSQQCGLGDWANLPLLAFFGGLCFHIHYKVTECLLTIVARRSH
jgi:hypothetical protein